MAASKAAAPTAAPVVIDETGQEINEAGDGATGSDPLAAIGAGGDAAQVPSASTAVMPAGTSATVLIGAGADAPVESLAAPVESKPVPMARIRALFPLEVDGVRIDVLDEVEIREALVAELVACRAAELLPDEAD